MQVDEIPPTVLLALHAPPRFHLHTLVIGLRVVTFAGQLGTLCSTPKKDY